MVVITIVGGGRRGDIPNAIAIALADGGDSGDGDRPSLSAFAIFGSAFGFLLRFYFLCALLSTHS